MFNLFKRKNEIKELKCRVEVLEGQVAFLKAQKEDVGVINFEDAAPKANKIIFKVASEEGNETTVTFDKEGMTLSVNKPKLKEESKSNRDLILQIDGDVVGKIALDQIKKMQRQSEIKMINV